jgi:hypothetical protein
MALPPGRAGGRLGLHRDGVYRGTSPELPVPSTLGIMSDATVNPDEAAEAARRLLEANVNERVNAVRDLAEAANEADVRERDAAAARERHTRAWDAALKAGWSDKDLRQTGARAPGATTPKRRTRRSNSAGNGSEQVVDLGLTS